MKDGRWQCKDIPDELVLRIGAEGPALGTGLTSTRVVAATGAPENVAIAKIMRLVDRGLMDYGTSPRSAWTTYKGRVALDRAQR